MSIPIAWPDKPNVAWPDKPNDLSWLADVTEVRPPLSEFSPIWVGQGTTYKQPVPCYPACHPYCEINMILDGESVLYLERAKILRGPGDLILLGPGMPHWGRTLKFPLRYVTVYFLPAVLIEMGPQSDGLQTLRRFTAKQSLTDRRICPPRNILTRLTAQFQQMLMESESSRYGHEIRLRTLLMEQLVMLLRWEQSQGKNIGGEKLMVDWQPILKTLHYLRDHYAEPIYARDMSRAAGVREARMKVLFKDAIGLSWVKYLQNYRIHRAAAMLNEPGHNVTEVALGVGFDCFPHFNKIFVSPRYGPPLGRKQGSYKVNEIVILPTMVGHSMAGELFLPLAAATGFQKPVPVPVVGKDGFAPVTVIHNDKSHQDIECAACGPCAHRDLNSPADQSYDHLSN